MVNMTEPSLGTASSVTTTTVKTDSSANVPDFTEFQLNPLHLAADSGTPAPFRLRETRRSFALYLEPCPGTNFSNSLQAFHDMSFTQFGPNHAHNSAPHVPILARVHIDADKDHPDPWHTVHDFIKLVRHEVDQMATLTPPELTGYGIATRPLHALLMHLRVNPDYGRLADRIERRLAKRCAAFDVWPMDRLHLAYHVLRPMSLDILKQLRDYAKQTIQVDGWVRGQEAWQLGLYEIMVESRVVGVQQQVKPIQIWPIRPAQQSRPSSLLPVAFRIKLAAMATWLHPSSATSSVVSFHERLRT